MTMFWNQRVEMVAQYYELLNTTEQYTLKWLIVCYVKMVESENVSNKSKNVNWYSSSRKKFGVSSKNKKKLNDYII